MPKKKYKEKETCLVTETGTPQYPFVASELCKRRVLSPVSPYHHYASSVIQTVRESGSGGPYHIYPR